MEYTYKISAQNHGGERVIGTIPYKIAMWWWTGPGRDLDGYFKEYYFDEDKDYGADGRWNHIPKEFRLDDTDWYERSHIFHSDACQFSEGNWIVVYAVEPETKDQNHYGDNWKEVANIDHKKLKSKETDVMKDLDDETMQKLSFNDGNKEECLVYGKRVYKGSWHFGTFTIDHKFDASKLTAITEVWGEESVLNGFIYDGEDIENEGCNSGDHKFDVAFFDD